MLLKCVKVCMSWNKRNNRNNMHGATIKKVLKTTLDDNNWDQVLKT